MKRTALLHEVRKMRFDEAYEGCGSDRLTQGEAAALLGESGRTFRRQPRGPVFIGQINISPGVSTGRHVVQTTG